MAPIGWFCSDCNGLSALHSFLTVSYNLNTFHACDDRWSLHPKQENQPSLNGSNLHSGNYKTSEVQVSELLMPYFVLINPLRVPSRSNLNIRKGLPPTAASHFPMSWKSSRVLALLAFLQPAESATRIDQWPIAMLIISDWKKSAILDRDSAERYNQVTQLPTAWVTDQISAIELRIASQCIDYFTDYLVPLLMVLLLWWK